MEIVVAVVWGIAVGWSVWLAWDIWHAWRKKRKDNVGGGTSSAD